MSREKLVPSGFSCAKCYYSSKRKYKTVRNCWSLLVKEQKYGRGQTDRRSETRNSWREMRNEKWNRLVVQSLTDGVRGHFTCPPNPPSPLLTGWMTPRWAPPCCWNFVGFFFLLFLKICAGCQTLQTKAWCVSAPLPPSFIPFPPASSTSPPPTQTFTPFITSFTSLWWFIEMRDQGCWHGWFWKCKNYSQLSISAL